MDKFTKTTEIDISNVNSVEDDTPQKSKVGKIIAAIVCILLAICAWVYVVETDDTLVEKEFNNVDVVVLDNSDNYTYKAGKVSVTLVGTNSELVDVDPSKIIVKVDEIQQGKGDVFTVETENLFYEGEEEVTFKEKFISVLITREEKSKK